MAWWPDQTAKAIALGVGEFAATVLSLGSYDPVKRGVAERVGRPRGLAVPTEGDARHASDILTAGLLRHITKRDPDAEGHAAAIHKWLATRDAESKFVPGTITQPANSPARDLFIELAGVSPDEYAQTAKALRTGSEKAAKIVGDDRFQARWALDGPIAKASGLSPTAMLRVRALYSQKVRREGPPHDASDALAQVMQDVALEVAQKATPSGAEGLNLE